MDSKSNGNPFVESKPYADPYFRWLAEDVSLYNGEEHWSLLHQMFCKPYYWIHNGDGKLAEDALEQRAFYQSIWRTKLPEEMELNCLEVLRYLSMRLSCMVADNTEKEWFWELMHNLKLDKFCDYDYVSQGGSDVVNYRLAMWLTRSYSPSGNGGLFPISLIRFFLNGYKANEDQTKLSTYEQAIAYVRTRYALSGWGKGSEWFLEYEEDF